MWTLSISWRCVHSLQEVDNVWIGFCAVQRFTYIRSALHNQKSTCKAKGYNPSNYVRMLCLLDQTMPTIIGGQNIAIY